jgi:dephospho-CoA kinase
MIIAVTGYTGAGKTTAVQFFPKSWKRVDVDALGHGVLKKKQIKKRLVAQFGKRIIMRGGVDRQKLRAKLLESQNYITELNKIIHPFLIREVQKSLKETKGNVVIDCALLKEVKLERCVDYIILIDAPTNILKKRQKAFWTKQEWELLLRNQKKIMNPDFIIENTGTKKELKQNLNKILTKIMPKLKKINQ